MSISVVVLTSASHKALDAWLERLCRQTRLPDQLVVVSREAKQEPDKLIAQLNKKVGSRFVLSVPAPPGGSLSQALIAGNACVISTIVCFTSDLCTPADDWLSRIEYRFTDPLAGAVGGPVIMAPGGRARYAYTDRWGRVSWLGRRTPNTDKIPRARTQAEMLNVNNMAFRHYLLPGFDLLLRGDGPCEADRCLALVKMGFRVVVDPGVRVYYRHPEAERCHGVPLEVTESDHHDNTYVFLKHSTLPQKVAFIPYTFLLGDEAFPGVLRLLFQGTGQPSRSSAHHLMPAMKGKAAGLRTYLSYLHSRTSPYRY